MSLTPCKGSHGEPGRQSWRDPAKYRCPECRKEVTLNTNGRLRTHGRRERKAPASQPYRTHSEPQSTAKSQILRHYHSWQEWLEASQADTDMTESHRSSRATDETHAKNALSASFEEGLQLAINGWQDQITHAERLCNQVSDEIITRRMATTFNPEYAVAGAVVDIGLYMAGDPECMVLGGPFEISKAGRAVRLAVPVGYPWTTSPETVIRRGAAVMALATLLARANHPLEIWAGPSCNNGSGMRLTYMVKVQAADEPLDAGRLMYAIAHPSMLRRLAWSVRETEDSTTRLHMSISEYGNYGQSPRNLFESDFPEDETVGNSIILPPLEDGGQYWADDKWVINWLNETITSIIGEE